MKKITIDDPESRSTDVVAENVQHLKTLFPEAFTEGQLDFEVLKQLLGGAVNDRRGELRPQLAWQAPSPPARADALHRHPTPVLLKRVSIGTTTQRLE